MKRISLYFVLICLAFGVSISVSFAATSTLSTAAPVVGSAVGENAGNLIFDYETGSPGTNEVSINANTLNFAGNFWSENVGWITLNGLGANGAKLTTAPNNMPMIGFAWSENAGWISFNPRGVINTTTFINSDVFFDKALGKFHGFAWSENVGWINMEGLMTDITAPDLTANFKPFAADSAKVFTLSDPSPLVPIGTSYIFKVDKWDSGNHTYLASTGNFTHDFRYVKPGGYNLKITDPFGNSSEGRVQVVANTPADLITAPIAGFTAGGVASSYTSTFTGSKVADAIDTHSMNISLRDKYGNSVINEPGIKTVKVRVAFNNNVDVNQTFLTGLIGDAIKYPLGTFGLVLGITSNTGTESNTSGNYSLHISSYAPTKAGYAFTNMDNISPQKLSYEITVIGSNSGVGEIIEQDKLSKIGTSPLNFSPALYIGNVTNTDNWAIRQGYTTTFNATLLTGTTVPLATPKVAHIFDIDANVLISYQNPSNITGGTKNCDGYMKTITTFNGLYTSSDTACSRPDSSNILITPTTLGSTMGFSWKPTIIYAAPLNNVVRYTSEISYNNNGNLVKYPSFARSTASTTLADGTAVVATSGIINQSVKIFGITTGRNAIDVLEGNNTSKVGSLTRTDIKNVIHKNVETMTRGGIPSTAKYKVYIGDQTFSSWPDATKDTIIIKGGDLTIDGNILNSSNIKGIIVLKDDAEKGGNVYIKKNVSNIAAVIFADKSILSGFPSPTTHYSDTQTATGQLFLEGSIISDNTIGGASMTPLKCPYNISGCTDEIAKHYDLNYFRFYTGTGASSPGAALSPQVPAGGEKYPFVIKYDTRLQTAPPPGFKIVQ